MTITAIRFFSALLGPDYAIVGDGGGLRIMRVVGGWYLCPLAEN